MDTNKEYSEYVLKLLASIGPMQTSRFFGGIGITCKLVQFAMIMGDSLYFVVDGDTRQKYEDAGMGPFSYRTKKGQVYVHRYFALPEEVLTDPEELPIWVHEAIRADTRANTKKRPKVKRLIKPKC